MFPSFGATAPIAEKGEGTWSLNGGWRFAAAPTVADTIFEISQVGYGSQAWLPAVVPGTVLTSYVAAGVYPDPTYGLNNLSIPESLNRQDYWYRTEFTAPQIDSGETVTLTLKGINYAADVWMNGKPVGKMTGAFARGIFNITELCRPGESNAVAIRISPPPHPGIPHEESLASGAGPNGGMMTFDGPTFFCTEGWDWIPGIRDRCSGLWQDVELSVTGPARLGDVQVITDLPLPRTDYAEVKLNVEVANDSAHEQSLLLHGELDGKVFEHAIHVPARARPVIRLDARTVPQLKVSNPRLWWPNGYGKPELYTLKLRLVDQRARRYDTRSVRFGIREVSYELSALEAGSKVPRRFEFSPTNDPGRALVDKRHAAIRKLEGGPWVPTLKADAESSNAFSPLTGDGTEHYLVIRVNGVRIVVKGGNWGMDDALKRSSRERLEPYVRLERDANVTMIRNWCGQNTQESLFELCDEYGIMVWSDFWASTQDWNQQPGDPALWLANAEDVIKRFRNHPSIVIWCGRNEGVLPPILNEGVEELVSLHDGTRYFQPTSVDMNLLPSGPWIYAPAQDFFKVGRGFTTEVGLPSVPTADAIRAAMPVEDQWPISDTWAYHDWHTARHGQIQGFVEALERQFGPAADLDDLCRKAQMLNYAGHRAMFEGLNAHLFAPASGRLMWMSHPAWLSMQWQLYSSDYDTHASYYGAKKGCEPVHIQLNADSRSVIVSNATRERLSGARAVVEVYDVNSRRLSRSEAAVDVPPNARSQPLQWDEATLDTLPLSFVRLQLFAGDGLVLSDNLYWIADSEQDFQSLNALQRVQLTGSARRSPGEQTRIRVKNEGTSIALLLKPTLRTAQGQRILPAYFSDGCFALLPGEERELRLDASNLPTGARVSFEGWNNHPITVSVDDL